MDYCVARMFLGYRCRGFFDGYARVRAARRKVLTSVINTSKYDGRSRLLQSIFPSTLGKQLIWGTNISNKVVVVVVCNDV